MKTKEMENKRKALNYKFRIPLVGYQDFYTDIKNNNWEPDKKEAWKVFEYVRKELYKKYYKSIRSATQNYNPDLVEDFKSKLFDTNNKNIDDSIFQWANIITNHCSDNQYLKLKEEMLNDLNSFKKHYKDTFKKEIDKLFDRVEYMR